MKKKVAFICVHNSCRSQIAEAWANHLGNNLMEVYSAGTESYPEIKPLAVKVMEEVGIDMSKNYPKLLADIPKEVDILITMGCNVLCPFISNTHSEDWKIDDPSGGTIEDFREARDIIKKKVEELIEIVKSNSV